MSFYDIYRKWNPVIKKVRPKFDQKKSDLDIFGFLKMSKMKIYKKSFGNACFLGPPYGVRHNLWKVWTKNALLTEKWTLDIFLDIFVSKSMFMNVSKWCDLFRHKMGRLKCVSKKYKKELFWVKMSDVTGLSSRRRRRRRPFVTENGGVSKKYKKELFWVKMSDVTDLS